MRVKYRERPRVICTTITTTPIFFCTNSTRRIGIIRFLEYNIIHYFFFFLSFILSSFLPVPLYVWNTLLAGNGVENTYPANPTPEAIFSPLAFPTPGVHRFTLPARTRKYFFGAHCVCTHLTIYIHIEELFFFFFFTFNLFKSIFTVQRVVLYNIVYV